MPADTSSHVKPSASRACSVRLRLTCLWRATTRQTSSTLLRADLANQTHRLIRSFGKPAIPGAEVRQDTPGAADVGRVQRAARVLDAQEGQFGLEDGQRLDKAGSVANAVYLGH